MQSCLMRSMITVCYESESEVAQSCQTLCDPVDSSPPGSSSMGFSRQEYWSGLAFPSPGDLPNLGMEPVSPALAGRFFTTEPPGKHMDGYTSLYICPNPQNEHRQE